MSLFFSHLTKHCFFSPSSEWNSVFRLTSFRNVHGQKIHIVKSRCARRCCVSSNLDTTVLYELKAYLVPLFKNKTNWVACSVFGVLPRSVILYVTTKLPFFSSFTPVEINSFYWCSEDLEIMIKLLKHNVWNFFEQCHGTCIGVISICNFS